jgi:hypothetical protein
MTESLTRAERVIRLARSLDGPDADRAWALALGAVACVPDPGERARLLSAAWA